MPNASRPRIAVTLGDPAGIGPEVALKALADAEVRRLADFTVFGPPAAAWARLAGAEPSFLGAAGVTLVDCGDAGLDALAPGCASREGGGASVRYVLAASTAART